MRAICGKLHIRVEDLTSKIVATSVVFENLILLSSFGGLIFTDLYVGITSAMTVALCLKISTSSLVSFTWSGHKIPLKPSCLGDHKYLTFLNTHCELNRNFGILNLHTAYKYPILPACHYDGNSDVSFNSFFDRYTCKCIRISYNIYVGYRIRRVLLRRCVVTFFSSNN